MRAEAIMREIKVLPLTAADEYERQKESPASRIGATFTGRHDDSLGWLLQYVGRATVERKE
jgi:hypothetical protein